MELLSRAIKQSIDQNYFGEINEMWPLERRVCFSAVNVKSALTLFAPLPSPPLCSQVDLSSNLNVLDFFSYKH